MTTFTLNGKTYQTDAETLAVLQSIMPSAKVTGDSSAVIAVVELGLATGRITLAPPVTKRVGEYDRITKDYAAYVSIDGGPEEYIGSRKTQGAADRLCDEYAFDFYADSYTPEVAAQIAAAAFESETLPGSPVCELCGALVFASHCTNLYCKAQRQQGMYEPQNDVCWSCGDQLGAPTYGPALCIACQEAGGQWPEIMPALTQHLPTPAPIALPGHTLPRVLWSV